MLITEIISKFYKEDRQFEVLVKYFNEKNEVEHVLLLSLDKVVSFFENSDILKIESISFLNLNIFVKFDASYNKNYETFVSAYYNRRTNFESFKEFLAKNDFFCEKYDIMYI